MQKQALLFILILLLISKHSRSNIIYVPDNFLSIQTAIDSSQNGDSIIVSKGTYHENISIHHPLAVIGVIPDSVKIFGINSCEATILIQSDSTILVNLNVNGKDTLQAANTDSAFGTDALQVDSCDYIELRNCIFTGGNAQGNDGSQNTYLLKSVQTGPHPGKGILFSNSSNIFISNCIIKGGEVIYANGFFLSGSTAMEILFCNKLSIGNSMITGGHSGGGEGGKGIQIDSSANIVVSSSEICGGNGGSVFGWGGDGNHAITINKSDSIRVYLSTLRGGRGASGIDYNHGGGGHGLFVLNSLNVFLSDDDISGGYGAGDVFGGGRGGNGVHAISYSKVECHFCQIAGGYWNGGNYQSPALYMDSTSDINISTEIYDYEDIDPSTFILYPNYPNPFNSKTCINFSIVKNSLVNIEIYNLLGQKVKTLIHVFLPAGTHKVFWDTTNDFNYTVGSGIYILTLKVNERILSQRINLIK